MSHPWSEEAEAFLAVSPSHQRDGASQSAQPQHRRCRFSRAPLKIASAHWKGPRLCQACSPPCWMHTGQLSRCEFNLPAGSFKSGKYLLQNGTVQLGIPAFAKSGLKPRECSLRVLCTHQKTAIPYEPNFTAKFQFSKRQFGCEARQFGLGLRKN